MPTYKNAKHSAERNSALNVQYLEEDEELLIMVEMLPEFPGCWSILGKGELPTPKHLVWPEPLCNCVFLANGT